MIEIKNHDRIENYFRYSDFLKLFSFDIKPFVRVWQFEPDEVIIPEGTEPHFLMYLIEGRAKVFLTHANGKVSLANFLTAPCFIGEVEFLEAQKFAKGVKAMTACTCFAIRYQSCKDMILEDAKFLRHLCIFLGKKAVNNTENYSRNLAYSLETRLAAFILEASRDQYYRERHTEISEYLGVTYRHFLYVLADFVKKGILKKTKQGYYIENMDLLRKIANKK